MPGELPGVQLYDNSYTFLFACNDGEALNGNAATLGVRPFVVLRQSLILAFMRVKPLKEERP